MAAGLGFKTFTTGEVLTAGDVNGYLMQGINVFASSAARAAAITSPQEGQYSFLKDTNALEYYDGAAWVGAPVGDITAVNAGTGISGGGASGAVTITNSMATEITAAGDIIVGTGSGTFDNLPIGTTAQVLTADTTVSPYKVKWATPAAGGGMTLLSTTTLTGASTTISSISGSYTNLIAVFTAISTSADALDMRVRVNSDTSTNYDGVSVGNLNGAFSSMLKPNETYWQPSITTNSAGLTFQICGAFTIYDYALTSGRVFTAGAEGRKGGSAEAFTYQTTGQYRGTSAITSITFLLSSGTYSTGTVQLYGAK
jgi:hypothetical protein